MRVSILVLWRITKPGLKIEPRDKDKPVYIIGNEGPVITVDLKENEFVVIKKILIAHSGINIATKQGKDQLFLDPNLMQRKANVRCLEEFDIQKDMKTVIMVQRGGLILRNCLLSLRSLPKNMRIKIPIIVAMPNTRVNIVNCEFMGNDYNLTAGCLFINSDVVMSSCKFNAFKAGGIFSVSHRGCQSVITDCEFSKCAVVGVYC